jgi:hypothetical protein
LHATGLKLPKQILNTAAALAEFVAGLPPGAHLACEAILSALRPTSGRDARAPYAHAQSRAPA